MDWPGKRKMQKEPIPRMGGFAIFATSLAFGLSGKLPVPWPILVGAVVVFLGGFLDDLTPANSVAAKLSFQIPGALIFALACDLSLTQVTGPLLICLRLVIFLFVLFMINAVNLMDNMNGLAAGLSLIITLSISGFAFIRLQDPAFGWIGLIVGSTVLGFCVRNFPLGKIYMGDQGSQFLGYFISAYAVLALSKLPAEHYDSLVYGSRGLGVLFLLFLWDVTSVTFIRLSEGRSPFVGDQCHLSHRLSKRRLGPTKAVLVLFAAQLILTLLTSLILTS
jgi:UDP-GlcNAc:undecaprenyl-phosphate/decaprenyl-phosphate GlcNAc-1-phosphate transferase